MKNFFILPGLYGLKDLNNKFLNFILNNNQYVMNENYEIYGIYGNFPNCIWNGENGIFSHETILNLEIQEVISSFSSKPINLYLNCSNSQLQPGMEYDNYSNIILSIVENNNSCSKMVITSPLLKNVGKLEKVLGQLAFISKEDCLKATNISYFLPPQYNEDIDFLKEILNKKDVIITLNSYCQTCKDYLNCYQTEDLAQTLFDVDNFKEYRCTQSSGFQLNIEYSQQIKKFNKLGFNLFYLDLYPNLLENVLNYINILIKPEYHDLVLLQLLN